MASRTSIFDRNRGEDNKKKVTVTSTKLDSGATTPKSFSVSDKSSTPDRFSGVSGGTFAVQGEISRLEELRKGAEREQNRWSIFEDSIQLGGFTPKFLKPADSKYKSAAEAKSVADKYTAQIRELANLNYEKQTSTRMAGIKADASTNSALTDVKNMRELERKIYNAYQQSEIEGVDRSDASLRALGRQYGLTEAETKNIWTMKAATDARMAASRKTLTDAGYDFDEVLYEVNREWTAKDAATKKTELTEELRSSNRAKVAHSAKSVLASPGQGVDYAAQVLSNWGRNDPTKLDTYRPMNSDAMSATNYVTTVRGVTGEEIGKKSKVGKFAYDVGMSIADNAMLTATLGFAGAGYAGVGTVISGIMGSSAASAQMKNILDSGGSNDQAIAGGLAAGVAEALFEKVSVDKLLTNKSLRGLTGKKLFKSLAAETLKQGGVEASEEIATELANLYTDAVIRGQDSDFQRSIQAYIADGMTPEAAKKQAVLDALGQVALAGLSGFVSGGVMGGAKTGIDTVTQNSDSKKLGAAVTKYMGQSAEIAKGLAAQEGTEARRFAEEAKKQFDAGKQVDDLTMGELTRANAAEAASLITAANASQSQIGQQTVQKAAREMQETGTLSPETAAELRAIARSVESVSPAATPSAQELAARVEITRAENPKSDVLDAATSMLLEAGVTKKIVKAKEKAAVIQKLINGEEVKDTQINMLDPTNKTAQAVFTQLTGVQFPAGKLTYPQLYELYRSAHEVAVRAAADRDVAAMMGDETDVEESGLLDYQTFADRYREVRNPDAGDEELLTAYAQFVRDAATVDMGDQSLTHDQFVKMLKSAPGGDQLSATEAAELWFTEVERTRAERAEQRKTAEAGEKARQDSLKLASEAIDRALKPYGLSTVVEYDMPDNDNAFVDPQGVIHFNGNILTTEKAMIFVLGHELVHRTNPQFVQGILDAFDALNQKGLIKDANLKHQVENRDERLELLSETYLQHLAITEKKRNPDLNIAEYKKQLKENGVGEQTWDEYILEEYAADLMRSVFGHDADVLTKLAAENAAPVKESLNWVKKLKNKFSHKDSAEQEIQQVLQDLEAKLIESLKDAESGVADDRTPADRHSVSTMLEAINLDVEMKDDVGRIVVRDAHGEVVTEVTEAMVRNSRLGAVLRESVNRGRITEEKMKKQITFFKDFTNQLLKTQDIDMLFAVSGSLGFQPTEAGEKIESDVGKDTRFAGYTKNSDPQYSTTVDFTTICLKTQAVIDAMSETMLRLGHGLTEEEVVDIVYKNTHEAGEPVPCPVCYVFSRWVGLGGLFDNMNNWQKMYEGYTREQIEDVIAGLRERVESIIGESVHVNEKTGETEQDSEGKARTKLQKALNAQARGIKKDALTAEADALKAERKTLPAKSAVKAEGKRQGWSAEEVDKRTAEMLDRRTEIQRSLNELRVQMQAKNLDALDAETLNLTDEARAELSELNKDLAVLDQWSWLTQVRLDPEYSPVDAEVLFDINRGNEFAERWPASWKYRTTRGPAMGKAAAPYTPMHLGQIIRGASVADLSELGKQETNKVLQSKDGELTRDAKKDLDKAVATMKAQNLMNGQRFQSTSDFRFEYALDYLLAFIDLQAIGGKVQLYTKVPEAVRFLASMGAEVNCSLMPWGMGYDPETKELLFSNVTGMDAEDAFMLAQEFDNVQTIMVGTSVEHIKLCMADGRIQFIIPYHASGSGEARYQSMMNTVGETVSHRDDFSAFQTDKLIETEDPKILNARSARKKILTGKVAELTAEERTVIRDLKDAGNDILWELHKRFTGRTVDGDIEPLNQKYLEPSQRRDGDVFYDETCWDGANAVKMNSAAAATVFPFEYWDKTTTVETADRNGEIFNEYCKILGLKPRFSGVKVKGSTETVNFNKMPGYWKMLIDRRMYNRDGSYHEQQAIDVTNFDAGFLLRDEAIKGIVQPSLVNDPAKTAKIAEKSVAEVQERRGEAKYSITPEFEQWYRDTYGREVKGGAEVKRRLQKTEARAKAAEFKGVLDKGETERAWEIHHKKELREQKREFDAKLEAARKAKTLAVRDAVAETKEVERAKAAVQRDADREKANAHVAALREAKTRAVRDARIEERIKADERVDAVREREQSKAAEQHAADLDSKKRQHRKDNMAEALRSREAEMAMKRQAAKRLHTKETAYEQKVTELKENAKLKRNAAKATLRNAKLAAKKRAAIETEQGPVNTIRQNPKERSAMEKRQAAAEALRTLGRSAYRNFVNMAEAIDRFAKRQVSGVRAGTLVNIVGGTSATVESIFKRGLVNRAGDQIGGSMSEVFLCWDGKKVNEEQQALLQDYMLHAHNVDRMSFVANAEAALSAFEDANPWLRDMDTKEFARLTAMTEKELEKTGQHEAHAKALEYAALLRRRNEAQNKPIFADENGNDVTADTSREICEKYLAENPWLEEKAQGIYEWWDLFMRTWAVGDTITEAEYEAMHATYPHYVPTYRTDKGGVGGANFVGMGAASVSKAVKRAKGGHSEVMNIEDSFTQIVSKIVRMNRVNELYMNIIDTAMLDDAGNFADMAYFDWESSWQSGNYGEALLDDELSEESLNTAEKAGLEKVGQDYKLTAWLNGRKYTAYISEDLYKSIGMVTGQLANDLEKGLLKAGNLLTGPMKTAITGINPSFALRNISRDLPTAMINSISGLAFPKYWARAAQEMTHNSENWQRFKALGGTHATYYNDSKGFAHGMASRDIGKNILSTVGWFNEVTEAQTRFAEYLATIDRLGDTYDARLQGIKNAAEVTVDFSRKGRYGKVINAWVPYWNPAVQGIDKTVRSVIESPDGSAIWKQAVKTVGRASVTTVLLEAVLFGVLKALDRDDEWEQLSDRTKDTYYCIPLKNSHTFLKIPKNREWGAILGTPFMRMLEYANGRENPFENYIETAIEPNFLPPAIFRPDAGGGFATDVIGFSQMNDLSKNEDFAGRTIVPYAYQQGSLSQQYDAETSWLAKQLGALFNWSPMQIDYIVEDYFGDFGEVYTMATSEAIWSGEQDVVGSVLDLVSNPWVADARYSNQAVSKYYDLTDKLDRTVQDRKNQLGPEKYKETVEYQTQKALTTMYGNDITALNARVRDLPDGVEKDNAKAQIAQLARAAEQYYEDCMAGKIHKPILDAEYADFSGFVADELIRMDGYSADYKFVPYDTPQPKYEDPDDDDREYILTTEQKDYFKQLYREQYDEIFGDLIQSQKYRSAKDSKKAEYLADTRDDVLDATKELFFDWLKTTGVRSTPKK